MRRVDDAPQGPVLFDAFWPIIEDWFERLDFLWNQTIGLKLGRLLEPVRHSLNSCLLLAALAGLTWTGPTMRPGLRLIVGGICFVAFPLVWCQAIRMLVRRRHTVLADVLIQIGLLLVIALGAWLIGGAASREATGLPYRHVGIPVIAILAGGTIVAGAAARTFLGPLRTVTGFEAALPKARLQDSRTRPQDSVAGYWRWLIVRPHYILLPAAIAVVLAPPGRSWNGDPLDVLSGEAVAAVVAIILLSTTRRRLRGALVTLTSSFFSGAALLTSSLVLVLAASRLFGLDYVTTLLEGTPGPTVIRYLLACYLLAWWYDYWTARLAMDQMLPLLGTPDKSGTVVAFVTDDGPAQIQVHGATRLAAAGDSPVLPAEFQIYDGLELFRTIARAAPTHSLDEAVAELDQRLWSYHALVSVLPIVVLFILWALVIRDGPQEAEAHDRLAAEDTRGVLDPTVALFGGMSCETKQPVIAIAASGGGTRAALYTAAVLESIHRLGRIQDVRMGSGVSGGGAALAYFAAWRPSLLSDATSWNQFFARMQQPYIEDVLNGLAEWRVARDTRLGTLLAESFARRWNIRPPGRATLAQVTDFGLILNASIAGVFHAPTSADGGRRGLSFMELEQRERRKHTSTMMAGGRLLLTNLTLPDDLTESAGYRLGGPQRPMVVVNGGGVSLAEAAALNANFPPAFSNAAVDINEDTRYWVTDGGATDNRGMEALLYAVRRGIAPLQKGACAPIHVIVADASQYSDEYAQDRGLGAMMSAGSTFAGLLGVELVRDITAKYQALGGSFTLHYLPMPSLLRHTGSFGTHWMLQPSVTVTQGENRKTLSGPQVVEVIRALATTEPPKDADARVVYEWAASDPEFSDAWAKISKALAQVPPPAGGS